MAEQMKKNCRQRTITTRKVENELFRLFRIDSIRTGFEGSGAT